METTNVRVSFRPASFLYRYVKRRPFIYARWPFDVDRRTNCASATVKAEVFSRHFPFRQVRREFVHDPKKSFGLSCARFDFYVTFRKEGVLFVRYVIIYSLAVLKWAFLRGKRIFSRILRYVGRTNIFRTLRSFARSWRKYMRNQGIPTPSYSFYIRIREVGHFQRVKRWHDVLKA